MWFDELLSAPNRVIYLQAKSDTVLVSDSSTCGFGAILFSDAAVNVVAGAWSATCRALHFGKESGEVSNTAILVRKGGDFFGFRQHVGNTSVEKSTE